MDEASDKSDLRKLNLGCGFYARRDCVNVDVDPRTGADVLHDLNVVPYPFPDARFDVVYATHVLEHLEDPFAAMGEWRRLLRPGGEIHVKVPHFSRGFTHPDHKRGFDVSFPLFFDVGMKPWYCGTPLALRKMRLRWNDQPYLKRYVASPLSRGIASLIGAVIDAVANLSPLAFSRLACFWVGGFEAIEFVFVRTGDDGH